MVMLMLELLSNLANDCQFFFSFVLKVRYNDFNRRGIMKNRYVVEREGLLLEYLYEVIDLPKKKVKQYLTHGNIYVENTRTTKYNYPLEKGMVITIHSKENEKLPFEILYEDDYIIVVNKPSGLLTIATDKEKQCTLYHMVRECLQKRKHGSKVFIIHRLDKETSGVLLLAKDLKTKNQIQQHWDEYVKVREYKAIVEGVPKKKEGMLIHYLKETSTNLVYVAKDGKRAVTSYKLEKSKNGFSLLTIFIETGRKNQIRVQLSHIGLPILGDKKYHKKTKGKRLYLHATRLKIFYPMLGKMMTFTAPEPQEFKKVV